MVTLDIGVKSEMRHPFRTILGHHTIRWCDVHDDKKYRDFFTETILNIFQKSVPQLFKKCPFEVS